MRKKRNSDSQETSFYSTVKAKTANQQDFINKIIDNDFTFCIGPAGTGKTFIACGVAAEYLKTKKIDKIVLTRPMVASESAGDAALPGDVVDKVYPYLIPLFDELNYFMDVEDAIRRKTVLIEPLAYLRGRNFKKAFVILDEAQNITHKQLILLMTRKNQGSKMVITGDVRQSDLNEKSQGALQHAIDRFDLHYGKLEGLVGITKFDKSDIVRDPKISLILDILEGEI